MSEHKILLHAGTSPVVLKNSTEHAEPLFIESAKWRVWAKVARVERVARLNEGTSLGEGERGSARVGEGRAKSSSFLYQP